MPTPAFTDSLPARHELLAHVPEGAFTHAPVAATETKPDVAGQHWLKRDNGRWLARVDFNPALSPEEQEANLDLLCAASRNDVAEGGHTPGPWAFEAQGEANLYFILDQDGKRPLARVFFNGENHERQCLAVLALWDEAHGAAVGRAKTRPSLPAPARGVELDR